VVNVSGGGSGIGDLLATTAIGAYSTTSTQATNMNMNIAATNVNGYDVLLVETSVDTEVANRHTATVGVAFITNSTNVSTKNAAVMANAKWNAKLSSTSVTQTTSSTTAYGIYPNSCTVTTTSNGTATFAMYARYNSTRSGTINGTYTARVYGIKLCDLIGG
jgi:galactitol-specific phosphotransferase system IIB component